jgi:dihydroflavonol-4-reductase
VILVTGASGCVGANLVHALVAADKPVAALLQPGDMAPALSRIGNLIERHYGDVRDPASLQRAMANIDSVYHAAGVASPRFADEARMWEVNVDGTRHVLEAARRAGVARVVHVSSIAAVGYPDGCFDESATYNGSDIAFAYMHSKHAAEQEVHAAVARGLDAVSVCPAAIIAPYCDRLDGWGRIILDVAERRMAFYPPGGIAYLGSVDLVAGLQAAMCQGRTGERYLLASGNTSYRELIDCFAAAAAVAPPGWTAPRPLVRGAARLLRAIEPVSKRCLPQMRLSSGVLDLLWRQKHYRTDKAARELGFTATQTLRSAVAETWCWLAALQQGAAHVA